MDRDRDFRTALQRFVFNYGLYVFLAVMIVFFSVTSQPFLTIGNWTQISIVTCFLLTVSAGLTVVVITRNIDLSVGSVVYMAGAVVSMSAGLPPLVSFLLALTVGVIAGLISGVLVAYLRMNSMLTTLGLMIAYRGISLLTTGGTTQRVGHGVAELGSIKLFGVIPIVFVVCLMVMILLQCVLSLTKFGAYCYAIGNNEVGAVKIGILVRRVKLGAFLISGICAALAGFLLSAYLGEATTFAGRGMEFQATAAVVIGGASLFGGRGRVLPGTLGGVLVLAIINNGLGTRGVSPYVYPFAAGVVIFVAIYLDSLKNLGRSVRFD
jgi:ribose/xylose/arabinose/galactoside ABC-type transport system permease subunit